VSIVMNIYDEYGGIKQLDKLIEELQEALEEATKLRGIVDDDDDINAENLQRTMQECADVEILIEQFMEKFNLASELELFKEYKIERQLRRIRNGK
jgi:hypothetical protein